MKGLRLMFVVVAAAAALSLAGASARAAGECRAQSPGVPGPSYVYFAVGSTKLDAKAKQDVKEVADRVKAMYIRTVCLLGSADKQGNEKANFTLSVKRAEVVAAALEHEGVARQGHHRRRQGRDLRRLAEAVRGQPAGPQREDHADEVKTPPAAAPLLQLVDEIVLGALVVAGVQRQGAAGLGIFAGAAGDGQRGIRRCRRTALRR